MPDEIIYMKTEKGIEEVERRSYNLPRRLRSALIMIDGHTPLVLLHERFLLLGDPDSLIKCLLADGFIKPLNPIAGIPRLNQVPIRLGNIPKATIAPKIEAAPPVQAARELKCVLHLSRCSGESCVMSNGCLKFNSMK